jgi:general secretion pathway protein I
MIRPAGTDRRALTLLEVVLALAILAGSFATLAQLVGLGMRAAGSSRELTTAQLLAESIMSEIAAGIVPAETLNRVPMDTHPGWLVSAVIDNSPHPGILRVTVIAERDIQTYRSASYQLSRWIRDPNLALPIEDDTTTGSSGNTAASSANNRGGNAAGNNNPPTGNPPANNSPTGNRGGGNARGGNRPGGGGGGGGAGGPRGQGPGGQGPGGQGPGGGRG